MIDPLLLALITTMPLITSDTHVIEALPVAHDRCIDRSTSQFMVDAYCCCVLHFIQLDSCLCTQIY